ncbi:MAG: YybH family protein [Gammaproteobacteria bacterium]
MSAFKRFVCLFIFTLAIGSLASYGQDDATDRGKIEAMLKRLETVFAAGDIDGAMQAFAPDAIIFGENNADIVGFDAIRAAYTGMLTAFDVELSFDTREVAIFDDTAYEQGLFTIRLTDKATGELASDTTSRHIHILKRQGDGTWKTWRMMTNTPAPAN